MQSYYVIVGSNICGHPTNPVISGFNVLRIIFRNFGGTTARGFLAYAIAGTYLLTPICLITKLAQQTILRHCVVIRDNFFNIISSQYLSPIQWTKKEDIYN